MRFEDIGVDWERDPLRANGHDTRATSSRVEFKALADFCREYVPLAYAVEPLLRTSTLYSLTARTGHGKTAFLIVAALAIATGRPDILGLDVARGRVAFLTFENPTSSPWTNSASIRVSLHTSSSLKK